MESSGGAESDVVGEYPAPVMAMERWAGQECPPRGMRHPGVVPGDAGEKRKNRMNAQARRSDVRLSKNVFLVLGVMAAVMCLWLEPA